MFSVKVGKPRWICNPIGCQHWLGRKKRRVLCGVGNLESCFWWVVWMGRWAYLRFWMIQTCRELNFNTASGKTVLSS